MKPPLIYGPEWVERTRQRIDRALTRAARLFQGIDPEDQTQENLEGMFMRVLDRAHQLGWIDDPEDILSQ